jgi:hypothetical protein
MASMGTMGLYSVYVALLQTPVEGPGFADVLTTSPLRISESSPHFTRTIAAALDLPILDAIQPPTRRPRSA